MPEEILKPIHYVNGDLEVSGSAKIKEVENGTGSIVTYDETTKELKKRTGAELIEDLNLAEALQTVPNTRELEAGKGLTGGGDLTANRKFDLGAGGAITNTSTNSVSEDSHTHELGADVKNDIANRIPYTGANKAIDFNTQIVTHNGIKRESKSIESPWLPISLTESNKVVYVVISNVKELNASRRLIIDFESIGGNARQFKLKKGIALALTIQNTLELSFDKFTEVYGSSNKQWTIGTPEKHSDSSVKIPLIWLSGSPTGVAVKLNVKCLVGNIQDIEFSTLNDPESTLVGVAPRNTEDNYIGVDNEQLGLSGNKKTSGQWTFDNIVKIDTDSEDAMLNIGGRGGLVEGGKQWNQVAIGNTSNQKLRLGSITNIAGSYLMNNAKFYNGSSFTPNFTSASGFRFREDGAIDFIANTGLTAGTNYTPASRLRIGNDGKVTVANLSGVGNRMIGVDTTGTLYATAIPTAENLNVYTKNQVNDLLAPKLDIEDLDGFVNNVTYNAANHKITFFKQNSPNIEVDLPIESLIKNVILSGNNLVFTFENNTTVSVPLNTLLVGVVKEVNGKVPNSQGVITLEISDIPSLSSALDGKSNIRLSNVVSDLSVAEKSAFRNKIGAGTVKSVSISLPDGFTTGVSTITDSGTFNITFVQGYSLPTTQSQNEWDAVVDEAVRLSGDQEIAGKKIALEKWTFVKPVVIPEGVENNEAVNLRQLGTKANRSLDNIPSNLTTLETNVIKQKLKIDNLQNTGNTYPLIMSSEFTEILTLIPEVTVENAVAYVRNRNLIVSITLKNATIANTDVVSVNSIVKLFSLPPEIIDILQAEITAIVPQVKLTSTDVYSTATNKMFLDFEDKSIKQPFRLTLRSSSSTIFYAEFECLDMV